MGMDEKARFKVDAYISTPPPWADPDDLSADAMADDAAAFNSAMGGSSGTRL